MKLLSFLSRPEIKQTYGTTHPLKSNTFWGIMISVIAPILSQAVGIDVVTIVDIIKNIQNVAVGHTYNFWQIAEVLSQILGAALLIKGTLSKNRKPLSID